jgi:ABC-2 type transport system permease protein
MTYGRIKNVLLKEWRQIFTDPNSGLMITLLPLLIVGQGILYIWLAVNFGGAGAAASELFQKSLNVFSSAVPLVSGLPEADQFKLLLLNQFNFYLLLIPTVIAVTITTFTLVDEKLTGSLEALLATPIRTWELLLGKALAGLLPALVMDWIGGLIFLLVVALIGWGNMIGYLVSSSWFLSLFLLTPAVALLSFILGIIGSSRARDSKSAQNFSVIIILPVLAIIVVQITGLVWFTPLLTVILSVALYAIDFFMMRLAVRLFKRESILIGWK